MISELDLDRAFADKLSSSREFQLWLLNQTKFIDQTDIARLLDKEQAEANPNRNSENWWRHWWCRLEDGSESETDIFVVFELEGQDIRIALHIEDKPPHGKFTPNQYLNYKNRAEFMMGKEKFMGYSKYTTILLAPNSFIEENADKIHHFECTISYERVAELIPLFGRSIEDSKNA